MKKLFILFMGLAFTVQFSFESYAQTESSKPTVAAQPQGRVQSNTAMINKKKKEQNSNEQTNTSKPKNTNKQQILNPNSSPQKQETILEKVEEKAESAANSTVEATEQAVEDIKESAEKTRALRETNKYFGYINYSPFDLLIPSKLGVTAGYNQNANTTWEIEYLKGSVNGPYILKDLGKMSDERISLIRRSYFNNNSFNVSYGISYFDFNIRLGNDYLNRLGGGNFSSIDVLEIQALGFNLGIGNRWTFAKNLTFGVDWISWSQPVFTLSRTSKFLDVATNQSDRENVDDALRWIGNFPRFTLLKLQLGATF